VAVAEVLVDSGSPPVNSIALWDGAHRKLLLSFGHSRAQPSLDDGRSYILVIGRSDGSGFQVKLQATAANQSGPIIVLAK
jgi:hypothetical protein